MPEDGRLALKIVEELGHIAHQANRIADALEVLAGSVRYQARRDYDASRASLVQWQIRLAGGHIPFASIDEAGDRIEQYQNQIAGMERAHPWLTTE